MWKANSTRKCLLLCHLWSEHIDTTVSGVERQLIVRSSVIVCFDWMILVALFVVLIAITRQTRTRELQQGRFGQFLLTQKNRGGITQAKMKEIIPHQA